MTIQAGFDKFQKYSLRFSSDEEPNTRTLNSIDLARSLVSILDWWKFSHSHFSTLISPIIGLLIFLTTLFIQNSSDSFPNERQLIRIIPLVCTWQRIIQISDWLAIYLAHYQETRKFWFFSTNRNRFWAQGPHVKLLFQKIYFKTFANKQIAGILYFHVFGKQIKLASTFYQLPTPKTETTEWQGRILRRMCFETGESNHLHAIVIRIWGNAVDNLAKRVFYRRLSVLAHIPKLNDVDLKCVVDSPAVMVDTWLAAGMAAERGKTWFRTDRGCF